MKLSNATLLPGVVVNAEDPKNLGRVKCIIAGKSDPETMNTEQLPWCAPLISFGYQRVSKPMEGQHIWVLHDESNYYEYYYLPAWDVNGNTEVTTPEADYDVIVSRPGEGFGAQSFYNSEEGFVTRIGNEVSTTMKRDNSIVNTDSVVEMSIRDKHVYCGTKDSKNFEPMVRGDKLYELLGNLEAKLKGAAQAAGQNMYTTTLFQPLLECSLAISNLKEEIRSQNSYVSE